MTNMASESLLNNRYRIERMLGQGGMGAVYLAQDTALDMQVAVKRNQNPAPESSSQFLREARLLASLRHPNLPRVTDYFILGDAQYLVMDYIPGRDLETLLKEEGTPPVELVMEWVRQIGSALSYLHNQTPPVIHRDVKPANIRLSSEGQAILVDFGIAKVSDPDQQQTQTGAMAYTPGYAPPEQYGGNVRTGPYSDQYSLAALTYHLLSGQKPADCINRALSNAQLVPLYTLRPSLPLQLHPVLEKALSLRPEDRYASIDDFLQALSVPTISRSSARSVDQTSSAAPTVVAPRAAQPAAAQSAPQQAGPRQVVRSTVETISAPGAKGRAGQRRKHTFAILLIILLLLGALGVGGAGLLYLRMPRQSTLVAPQAIAASHTPLPSTDTPIPVTVPSQTEAPVPTATSLSSPTTTPTQTAAPTAVPSATPFPLGGGGLILFSSDRADGQTLQLWTMRVTINDQSRVISYDLSQLTDSPGDKTQAAWSPDGQRIVYVSPGVDAKTSLDLWVINADGSGTPYQLTTMNGDETEPAWSPDGKWIAFTNNGRGDKIRQLYLIQPDGSGWMKLSYDQEEFGPAWAPNLNLGFVMKVFNNQVLYIRGQRDIKTGATATAPYYVTPVFFDLTALHGNLGQVAEPSWSPDGKWMVYTRQKSNAHQIYLSHYPVGIPEKDILQLTEGKEDANPSWSPDGQWILFSSKRDGNTEIYLMRSTGQNQWNISGNPGQDVDAAWQPQIKQP